MLAAPLVRACHKTKLCRFNLRGLCNKGEACNFAHGEEERKPLPDLSRTRLCPTLISTGDCSDLKVCPFAHSREELRSRPTSRRQEAVVGLAVGPRGKGGFPSWAQGPVPRQSPCLMPPPPAAAAAGRAEDVDLQVEMEEEFRASKRGMVFGSMVTEDPERTWSFLNTKNTFIHFEEVVEEERRRSSSAPCRGVRGLG
mmetsp:Transcript_137121/g.382416  ORF Transcript_137121/g.382416 Transcript_137121/m.382416 type:complete len:198 (-) Transcript_137121:11-604(-)